MKKLIMLLIFVPLIYSENIPPNQRDALKGTNGTPANTNRYVTNSDPRLTGGIPDAPYDGQQYARQSHAWSVVTAGGSTGWYELDGNGDIMPRTSQGTTELFETDGNGDLEPK